MGLVLNYTFCNDRQTFMQFKICRSVLSEKELWRRSWHWQMKYSQWKTLNSENLIGKRYSDDHREAKTEKPSTSIRAYGSQRIYVAAIRRSILEMQSIITLIAILMVLAVVEYRTHNSWNIPFVSLLIWWNENQSYYYFHSFAQINPEQRHSRMW